LEAVGSAGSGSVDGRGREERAASRLEFAELSQGRQMGYRVVKIWG